jgi:Cytochrome P450
VLIRQTSSTFNSILLAAVANPHVVKEAHKELDRVIGPDRLPQFTDEPNLPYIRAIIKEIQRYRPVAAQGFPHATSKDDVYEGHLIPQGTIVLANAHSVHFNATRHPNPDHFLPERWLDAKWDISAAEAAAQKDAARRDHFAYGVGRRICPGIHVAENSLFLLVSRVFWGFDVGFDVDGEGRRVEIDVDAYAGGGLHKPDVFRARITPRSETHAEVMRREWDAVKSPLGTLGDVDKERLEDLDRMYNEIYGGK